MSTTLTTSKLDTKVEYLRYTPGSPITYERWLRFMYALTAKTFGKAASLFLTGVRHAPPMPLLPEGYDEMAAGNPQAIIFQKRLEHYAKAIDLANEVDQKIFGLMWSNMSEDSVNRAARVAPTDQWRQVMSEMDAQSLMTRIRASHQGVGASIPVLNWDSTSVTLHTMTQGPNEDVNDLKARFDSLITSMTVLQHPCIPNQQLVAARFLGALHVGKYKGLIAHIENEATSGAAEYPATLDNAFARAVNYKLTIDVPFVTKSEPLMPSAAVMYNNGQALGKSRQRKLIEGKSGRPKSPPTATAPSSGKSTVTTTPRMGFDGKPRRPCKLCGDMSHFMDHCPLADDLVKKFKHTQSHKVHYSEPDTRGGSMTMSPTASPS